MLEQRYRQQQFQEMIAKVQREHQKAAAAAQEAQKKDQKPAEGAQSASNGVQAGASPQTAKSGAGQTLLARAAREQLIALQ